MLTIHQPDLVWYPMTSLYHIVPNQFIHNSFDIKLLSLLHWNEVCITRAMTDVLQCCQSHPNSILFGVVSSSFVLKQLSLMGLIPVQH